MLDYTATSTVEEAIRILAEAPGTAKVLSGGTDLLVQLRSGRTKPDLIVDIKKIPGMSGIRERDGAFVIGAATPGAVIGECEALKRVWPGVVEAANLIGSTQVQGLSLIHIWPLRIRPATLESQMIHMIQQLIGQTLRSLSLIHI